MTTITRRNLLAHVASLDENRPALTGILLKGDKAISADGFILLATHIPSAPNTDGFDLPADGVILRAKDVANIAKTKPWRYVQPEHADIGITFTSNGRPASHATLTADNQGAQVTSTVATIDAKFPDYTAIIPPNKPDDHVVSLSMDVLAKLVKALSAAGAEYATFHFPTPASRAIRVDAHDEDIHPITAVVMPFHVRGK